MASSSSAMLKTLTILPSCNSTISSKPSIILFPSRLPSLKSKHSFRDFAASLKSKHSVEGASGSCTEPFNRASVEAYKVATGSEIPIEDVDKIKLMSLALGGGHSEFFLESLSTSVRKRVEVLQEIQRQHNELEAIFCEERAALEAKYQKLYEPLYTKRYDIVNGVVEVEGVSGEAIVDKNDHIATEVKKDNNATKEKGVPNFWLLAMKTNEVLADEIQERDEGALKYLKDIKWSRVEGLEGFKLDFFFDPNPYFKNIVLTKTYDMMEDEVTLDKAIGTEIEWLPEENLTQMVLKKVPRKGSKNTKPVTKTEKCESFFNFFNPPQVPDDDDDIDDETAEALQGQMMQDYHVGEAIRDTIIPHAVSWFTGEALEADEFEAFDEEDNEDYEDDEDDEEEDEGKTKKK